MVDQPTTIEWWQEATVDHCHPTCKFTATVLADKVVFRREATDRGLPMGPHPAGEPVEIPLWIVRCLGEVLDFRKAAL